MRVEVEALKPGVAGVEQTVRHITRLIREGASNPLVIDEARRAVRRARPHDTAAEWRALWDYVTGLQGWPYRFDPVDVEWTQAATRGGVAGGDCDDFAVRCGALLEALGYPVQVEVAGQKGKDGPIWHHVYVVAQDPRTGKWSAFDPSVTDRPGQRKGKPGDRLQTEVQKRFPVQASALSYRTMSGSGFRPSRLGYTADHAVGYTQQLGGPLDFLKSVVKTVDSAVNKVYSNVIKHVDPTRPENAVVRTVLQNVPGGGAALTAIDAFSTLNKNVIQPATKTINSLPSAPQTTLAVAPKPAPVTISVRPTPVSPLTLSNIPVGVAQSPPLMPPVPVTSTAHSLVPPQVKEPQAGMSMGVKVGIGLGGLAAAGGLVWALTRKPKRRKARRR